MVNAWSLLYDEMEELMITPADDKDWEDFWSAIENKYEFTLTMNQDPNRWKYSEDEILKELQDQWEDKRSAMERERHRRMTRFHKLDIAIDNSTIEYFPNSIHNFHVPLA